MEGHARKMRKMHGTKFLILVWTITKSKRKNWKKKVNCQKLFPYCIEMFVPGTDWSTWHSVASQQPGTICHKMDTSMWQTTDTINFQHSFYEWLRPMLSCGQCALSIGVISRFRLYKRSWRLKINIKRSFVHSWKSSICSDQLDVQEANVSASQFWRIRDHVVGCWLAYGRFMGFWSLKCWGTLHRIPKHAHGKLVLRHKSHQD